MTTEGPGLALIPEAITRAAGRRPNAPALAMAGLELSYADLEQRTNQVANTLRARGVRRGDRVGLYAGKSLDLLVALYGIMKAGAAYVPINPDSPPAYVRHLIEDCEIGHLVAGPTTRTAVAELAREVDLSLCLGIEPIDGPHACLGWDQVYAADAAAPSIEVSPEDLAYIIFTSGSTGRPKGIMHTHRSGLAYGEIAASAFGLRPADRIANHAPLNFDLCLLELWGGIVAGATIVIVPEAHARLPASLSQLLAEERVTVVNVVPFALVQLLHRGALDQRDLSSLRWVIFGGEAFPTKDLRSLMDRLPDAGFANVYGPAEVNGATFHVVPPLPPDFDEPISIGTVYPGVEALIVDDEDRVLGPGRAGELLINSPAHMAGYWRRPELTERSTYVGIDEDGSSRRWHRTGDVVELRDDGLLRLLGRKDRMIKTRGFRVELDEVEAALVEHPAVEQAAVFPVPDGEGSRQIEAAVTLHAWALDQDQPPTGAALRRHTARRLPRYAVPREVRVVESLARTSTGKTDRTALADRSGAPPSGGAGERAGT